jgi:hypothetical protein
MVNRQQEVPMAKAREVFGYKIDINGVSVTAGRFGSRRVRQEIVKLTII